MVHIKHDVTACQTLPIKRSAALTMAVPTLLLTLATLLCASAAPAPERAPLFASFSEEEATLYQPDGNDEGGDVVPGAESIDERSGYKMDTPKKSAAAFDVSISPVDSWANILGEVPPMNDKRRSSICFPIKVFTKAKYLTQVQLTVRWNPNVVEDDVTPTLGADWWTPTSKMPTSSMGGIAFDKGQVDLAPAPFSASLKPGVWHKLGDMCLPVRDDVMTALATFSSYDDVDNPYVPKLERAEPINLSMQLKMAMLADDKETSCSGSSEKCTNFADRCSASAPKCTSVGEISVGASPKCTAFSPAQEPHLPHWYMGLNGRCQSMKAEFDPNTQCTPSKMAGNRGTMGHLYCVRGPAPQLYHHKWELNSCSFASTSDEYNAAKCTAQVSKYRTAKAKKKNRQKKKLCNSKFKCSACATDVCA